MWQSLNHTISAVCGSPFWDENLTWNSPEPVLTDCFEKTILVWFPCAFLWSSLPLEIYFLRKTKTFCIPFYSFNIIKLMCVALMNVTILAGIFGYVLSDNVRHSVFAYSSIVQCFTFCLFLGLTYANIKCGVRSSGTLFFFSFLLAFCGAPRFFKILKLGRDALNLVANREMAVDSILYLAYYSLALFVLFLNCFADKRPAEQDWLDKKNRCPRNDSSFLSKILFTWVDKFAWKGYKHPLKSDDVWDLDLDMRTEQMVAKFESKWHQARDRRPKSLAADIEIRYENRNLLGINEPQSTKNVTLNCENARMERVSIQRSLFAVFGPFYLFGCSLRLAHTALTFASPPILSLLLDFVANREEFVWRGFLYAFLLLTVQILRTLLMTSNALIMYQTGARIRTVCMSIIYKKALRISSRARKEFTFGEIVNLIAVDAHKLSTATMFIPPLFLYPLEVCISFFYLWNVLGPCVIVGVSVLIVLVIFAAVIMSKIQKLQVKQMKYKDERVKLTNEILSGIKVLKLYAHEPSFEKYVSQIRSKEIGVLKKIAYLQAASSFIWTCSAFLISCVTFGVYVFVNEKNVLDAKTAFVSLCLFNIMKTAMRVLPMTVKEIVQCAVSMKRINKFLNAEELDPDAVTHEERLEPIVIEDGEFSWSGYEGASILSNIHLRVSNPGELVAVVGHVGSGKSSLLSAILGEMYKQSGYVNTTGKLAYVPQEAWIQNATLRDNITFGGGPKDLFYESILKACALVSDVEILPDGDKTIIGEKGMNISGGQKQRISLARAVYSEADIYLLDDPLSAVDAHVGKHIFEKVIGPSGLLKGKTRVFVTHNITYLPWVDSIIVLQNGTISETGTYDELLKADGDFARFLASRTKENEETTAAAKEAVGETPAEIESENFFVRRKHVPERASSEGEEKDDERVERSVTVKDESQQTGNVRWEVFAYYLGAIGPLVVSVTLFTCVLLQVFSVASDYWLSAWSSSTRSNVTANATNSARVIQQHEYVLVYALLGVGQAVCVITQTVVLYVGMLKAAEHIHNLLLTSVLRWPLSTFDRVPSGRIINRLGSDVEVLDNTISYNVHAALLHTANVLSTLCVISINTPSFLSVSALFVVLYYFLQRVYAATSKQLQRFDSASKSPIYSQFGDCISGACSVRAYGLQTEFLRTYERTLDTNLKNLYANVIVTRWVGMRVDLLGVLIVFGASLFAVLARNVVGAALVGLSVTYALQVTENLFWWIMTTSDVEMNIVAVERIKEYSDIEPEAAWTHAHETVPKNWPSRGEITFKDFQLRYHANSDPVLRAISFSVSAGEKVGIVGRTGAGKSSLTLGLFRIVESSGGGILIDGIDISTVGLHTLRGRLTIIPQDPVLFSGTLRMNLDPAGTYSDDRIWKALELTNLKSHVSRLNCGLQYVVEEGGSNFSIGQKQLICLARALLRKTRVLILDEATAAIDLETDDLIQATIREEFRDSTVLTIAHRLNTILDYNRILVLDGGRIAEFDSPKALLESKQSIFYSMARDAGLTD